MLDKVWVYLRNCNNVLRKREGGGLFPLFENCPVVFVLHFVVVTVTFINKNHEENLGYFYGNDYIFINMHRKHIDKQLTFTSLEFTNLYQIDRYTRCSL